MTEVSAPMTGPNKAVLFASIGIAVGLFLLTVEADSQNQFPAVIWAYTAWKTYKQDFAALVTAQKFLVGAAALILIVGAVTVGDAKSELILGLSPSDMILGGLISFIAHFWLLNFFKGQLPDVSRSAVANQELLEKEDSAAKITQTAQQETQVDSDPQIKRSDSTSGATASTEQAQPAGNKGAWITTIAVVMFLGLLVLLSENMQEQDSADSSTVSKREIAKEPVAPAISLAERDAGAQYALGVSYDNGYGVPEDLKEAAKWYRLAADQGHAEAQYNLGQMYAKGNGVPEDDKEALKWFRLAAEQGVDIAQYNLGVMYFNGDGVPEDNVQAFAWANIAGANGYDVSSLKEMLKKVLSQQDMSEAQSLTRQLKKDFPDIY